MSRLHLPPHTVSLLVRANSQQGEVSVLVVPSHRVVFSHPTPLWLIEMSRRHRDSQRVWPLEHTHRRGRQRHRGHMLEGGWHQLLMLRHLTVAMPALERPCLQVSDPLVSSQQAPQQQPSLLTNQKQLVMEADDQLSKVQI